MIDYEKKELLLSVKNVSLRYEKPILNEISLDIHNITRPGMVQGQIISICGKSGCGKTSLFNLLSGYNNPDSGEIFVGIDQHKVTKGEMGVVPQDYTLFNHRTVYDNLNLALWNAKGVNKKKTIDEYAEYFGLTGSLTKYPCDLSGGQKQRVSILQQVLAGNKFILLDEPFSGLDVIMKDKVIDILLKVANLDELNTLIVVSHDIESACAISDTVYVLSNQNEQGSTVVKTYDLLSEDLAYQKGIKDLPRFREIINEIKSIM
jgi:ABC-type nitrate/sulfonate/bicarbonate transport system ATPase subunit